MTRRLAASLQKKFGPILKSKETFPTLDSHLRMRLPIPRVREVWTPKDCDPTFVNHSQACCECAEKSLGRFLKARNLFPLWLRTCACAGPYLGWAKFRTPKDCDPTLPNDSQACCESAEKVCADSKIRKLLPLSLRTSACACPCLGCAKFGRPKIAI